MIVQEVDKKTTIVRFIFAAPLLFRALLTEWGHESHQHNSKTDLALFLMNALSRLPIEDI